MADRRRLASETPPHTPAILLCLADPWMADRRRLATEIPPYIAAILPRFAALSLADRRRAGREGSGINCPFIHCSMGIIRRGNAKSYANQEPKRHHPEPYRRQLCI